MIALSAPRIFDGQQMLTGHALVIEDGQVSTVCLTSEIPMTATVERLTGLLTPGMVDLQVNGGGGVMLNNAPSVDTLRCMAAAHASVGATAILPTLITDSPEVTAAAISAAMQAIADGTPGLLGLHLEGPHIAPAKKGAHDARFIRPMTDADLATYIAAARALPVLKVTLAPEAATPDQIAALATAGILVSLGHSDADAAACKTAISAGARCVTHLFNAMSQITAREPGLVGTALHAGQASAGLIADLIHVDPANISLALRAKQGPGQVFLVSDAMATSGSDLTAFALNGRTILRDGNRLTLEDGTLAGAHLTLPQAVANLSQAIEIELVTALRMATTIPATVARAPDRGHLCPGARADILLLNDALRPVRIWKNGVEIPPFCGADAPPYLN